MPTHRDVKIWAQSVAETVAETGGAPEGIMYMGLQRVGLPHGAAGLEIWAFILDTLKRVGYVTVSGNFVRPTEKLLADLKKGA